MSRIKIKNFGPIHGGFIENDGWMDVKKVTMLIGDQGSGKSTMAKLVSLFSWMEKSLVSDKISGEQLNVEVFKNLCVQQEIYEYFSEDTILAYEGDVCNFEYDESKKYFKGEIVTERHKNYILPKIQYVSAARNLLTILYSISLQNIIDKAGNIIDMSSNIPFMVRDLNIEYMKAMERLAKKGYALPINDTSVYYQNHNTFVVSKGKRISMSAASSGVQSITPLLIVSSYLSGEVQKDIFEKIQNIDTNLKNRIEQELSKESESLSNKFKQIYSFGKGVLKESDNVSFLEKKLKSFIPSSFINIVEEPEQNLFPSSQQKVLYSLLEHNNAIDSNKLIVTTHSPYIINYLMLAIKALEIEQKAGDNKDIKSKIYEIVPEKALIPLQSVAIYELDEKTGNISCLENTMGLPSNENYLNNELGETNTLFSNLMEIEDLCGE
ncbi:MAG: AAA family ATPase [Bacteroidales bacterium]|nr:AAA family ATPase [Bacteroidales bacterium]